LLVTRQHRRGFPCCVRSPCACMPPPNTPAEPCGACVARFPQGVGLPRFGVGSASATSFRGLLGVHCALQPACSLNPQGDPFLEVLQQKSLPPSTASSATGRSDRGRAGIAPAEKPPPFHGTHQRTYLSILYCTTTATLRRAPSVAEAASSGRRKTADKRQSDANGSLENGDWPRGTARNLRETETNEGACPPFSPLFQRADNGSKTLFLH
jgi:hypothetical protein